MLASGQSTLICFSGILIPRRNELTDTNTIKLKQFKFAVWLIDIVQFTSGISARQSW